MPKEEVQNWMRTAVTVGAILIAIGGYVQVIKGHSIQLQEQKDRNEIQDETLKQLIERLHTIEVNQAERIATDKSIASSLARFENSLDSIRKDQAQIKTDIVVIQTKVETLITDE